MGFAPAVFYRYAPDRKGEQAEALLTGCKGFLHADAYAGFNTLYRPDPQTLPKYAQSRWPAGHMPAISSTRCMQLRNHRRQELLEHIGELFAIEADIRGHSNKIVWPLAGAVGAAAGNRLNWVSRMR